MFQLIESLSPNFIRFQPTGSTIREGHIVQLVTISDDIYVQLSNGDRPFGFAGEIEDNWVKIYSQHMICRSDHFDKSISYKGGDRLYVKNGMLTTIKSDPNHLSVGNVISHVISNNSYLELNWI